MANPIKASDLYVDDGAINAAIKSLEDLSKAHEKALKKIQAQAKSLEDQMTGPQKTPAYLDPDQLKKTASATDKLEKEQAKLQETYTETAKKIATLRDLKNEQNRINRLEAKLAKATAGSYEALSAQYSLNRIQINKLSKEYLQNDKAGKKLVKETKKLRDAMKESQEATGNMSLNVGNYTDSIKEALPITAKLSEAFKVLSKTPLLAVFSLIVGALAAVFEAFKKTERGAEVLAKVGGVLSGVMSVFVGIVDKIAEKVISAFEDPQQALKDFGDLLKERISNRFEALLTIVPALATSLKKLFQRDLAGAKDALKEAGTAAVQFATGLDEADQKKFSDALTDTTKAINNQVAAFAALASAQRAVRKENRNLSRQLEEITTKAELYSRIAGDTTLGFQEQREAVEQAQKAIEKKAQLELRIAQNTLSIINKEIKLRKQSGENIEDLADQQLAAYQQLKQAERELTLAVRDNAQQRREINRDDFERELDFAIDAFDTIKAVNERRIKDEQISFESRSAILAETRELTEQSFADQIKLTEDYLGQKLNLDQLALESDQRVIRDRLRAADVDDVTLGRILEIIRERKLALQDLVEAEKDLFASQAKAAKDAAKAVVDSLGEVSDAILRENEIFFEQLEKIKTTGDIFKESLGITDKNEKAFEQTYKSAFDNAKTALSGFLSERQRLSDVAVQASEAETSAAKDALDAELALQKDGLANRAASAREELNMAKANETKARREQEKSAKAQRRLQTIEQTTNLITATSKIWGQLGFPLAIPAIGVMWGSFLAAKVRAAQVSRDNFRDGTFEILRGGSHQSGRDIPLGIGSNGRERRAEGGEGLAIFSKASMRQYGGQLPEVVKAINNGTFQSLYGRISAAGRPGVVIASGGTDTSKMESELSSIRQQGERKYYTNSKGQTVEKYKNLVRVYGK